VDRSEIMTCHSEEVVNGAVDGGLSLNLCRRFQATLWRSCSRVFGRITWLGCSRIDRFNGSLMGTPLGGQPGSLKLVGHELPVG
jgi:hypothetical protein